MTRPRRIIIIAGPNGAGKTTFAKAFLPHEGECVNFINADLIAAGLSPFKPEAAAVQAGRVIRRRFRQGWLNFETLYRPLVNHWELYDNSGDSPVLIEQGDLR